MAKTWTRPYHEYVCRNKNCSFCGKNQTYTFIARECPYCKKQLQHSGEFDEHGKRQTSNWSSRKKHKAKWKKKQAKKLAYRKKK